MGSMKKIAAFLSMLPLAMGTEEAMQKALSAWQHEVAAYEAAVKEAPSDDARASITRPDENAAARRLWHAVSGRTGSRKQEKGKGSIPVFEFEKSFLFLLGFFAQNLFAGENICNQTCNNQYN